MEVEVHITSQFLHVIIHWKHLIKKGKKLKKVNDRLQCEYGFIIIVGTNIWNLDTHA